MGVMLTTSTLRLREDAACATDGSDPTRLSPSLPGPSAKRPRLSSMSSTASGREIVSRPKSRRPTAQKTGLIVRPRGRTPHGKRWDGVLGRWVPTTAAQAPRGGLDHGTAAAPAAQHRLADSIAWPAMAALATEVAPTAAAAAAAGGQPQSLAQQGWPPFDVRGRQPAPTETSQDTHKAIFTAHAAMAADAMFGTVGSLEPPVSQASPASVAMHHIGTDYFRPNNIGANHLGANHIGTDHIGTDHLGTHNPGADNLRADHIRSDHLGAHHIRANHVFRPPPTAAATPTGMHSTSSAGHTIGKDIGYVDGSERAHLLPWPEVGTVMSVTLQPQSTGGCGPGKRKIFPHNGHTNQHEQTSLKKSTSGSRGGTITATPSASSATKANTSSPSSRDGGGSGDGTLDERNPA